MPLFSYHTVARDRPERSVFGDALQTPASVWRCKAQELGQKIRGEDGVANAVEAFHRHLGLIG
ncbi:hypothetical protein [Nostoc sp.]